MTALRHRIQTGTGPDQNVPGIEVELYLHTDTRLHCVVIYTKTTLPLTFSSLVVIICPSHLNNLQPCILYLRFLYGSYCKRWLIPNNINQLNLQW
jgi:hypothetical protein